MDTGIRVQFVDFCQNRRRVDVPTVSIGLRLDSNACAGLDLVSDVQVRRGIVADKNNCKAWSDTAFATKVFDTFGAFRSNSFRDGLTVDNCGYHVRTLRSQGYLMATSFRCCLI